MPQLLIAMIVLPLAGGIALGLLPERAERLARPLTIVVAATNLVIASILWLSFDGGAAGMQFESVREWIPGLNTSFHLGVDGTSLPLVFLTAFLTLLSVIASANIRDLVRRYFALLLLLEAGLIGVFVALDLVLFYVFWEVVLIPMFFLISIWGGARRRYAAVKFFVYTLAGSMAMLAGIIAIFLGTGAKTFDMIDIAPAAAALPASTQAAIFGAIAIALAVKVPIVPFHTWLPDAHVEAPTAVSVLLAGVLLKMGSYGFLRFGPQLLPEGFAAFTPALALLGAVSIVYGAAVALMQTDLKKLVAYSSVSHMGYVMLGIASGTTAGILGANVQMFSHGLIAGMLFLLVGALYERAHTREIEAFGGIAKVAPILAGTLVFASFASAGLPAMSGFIGEFMVILGAFEPTPAYSIMAAAAVALTVTYLLWMVRRVAFGPTNPERTDMGDMRASEFASIFPLCIATAAIGIQPDILVRIVGPASEAIQRIISG